MLIAGLIIFGISYIILYNCYGKSITNEYEYSYYYLDLIDDSIKLIALYNKTRKYEIINLGNLNVIESIEYVILYLYMHC